MFGLEEREAYDTQETVHVLQEDEDFFQAVQRGLYHINGENLVYEYDIIKRFITALRTDQTRLINRAVWYGEIQSRSSDWRSLASLQGTSYCSAIKLDRCSGFAGLF